MTPAEHESASGFAFLFRGDQGVISRAQWWRGTAGLSAVLAVLSGILLLLFLLLALASLEDQKK